MTMMNSQERFGRDNDIAPSLEGLTEASLAAIQGSEEKITSIPDRMYFRIGDVAEIAGVQPYVLRFWEKEFDFLAPIKNAAGQRLYRKSDVESVLLIKKLLYLERYSIEGAKKRIKELRKTGGLSTAKKERGAMDDHKIAAIRVCKEELRALIDLVS